MPYTWNSLNTHAAGEVLPIADWNQAALVMNGMVGTWTTTGLMQGATTTANGTPPFYCYFGFTAVTLNASSQGTITIPNGGFPNGTILAMTQIGSSTYPGYTTFTLGSTTTATTVTFLVSNAAGTGPGAVAISQLQFFIIGY
jgi:hypothetical protein